MTAPARAVRDIPEGTRCILYTRVSTPRQAAEEKASLDAQLAACRRLAADLGHADPWVEQDKGRSAFKEKGRVESLVNWCEAHAGAGFIIMYTHSRFSRFNPEDATYWVVRLRKAGWSIRFVDSPITGDVTVDAMNNLMRFSMTHAESVEKQKRSRMGARAKANRGEWNGGTTPPLGYAVGDDKRLEPGDAAEVKKVRAAFKAYVGGATLEAVARGLGTGRRGRPWNPSGARALLANPAYVGTVEWGRRKGSTEHGGKAGAHPALVDRATWDAAQDRLRSRGAAYAHGAKRPAPAGALPYVLSGLARCACGRPMVGGGGIPTDATEEERLRWRRYQCKACRGSVQQAALEAAVVGAVTGALRAMDERGDLERMADRWVKAQLGAGDKAGTAREREDLLKRKARLLKLAETTDDADVGARLRDIGAALARLDAAAKAKPDARALRAWAADVLARTRAAAAAPKQDAATPAAATPAAVSASLRNVRPLLASVTFDRDTRSVEVNFSPWANETMVGVVPKPGRAPHSGYNAPWRAEGGVIWPRPVTARARVAMPRRRRAA